MNEPQITVVGNLVSDPELRMSQSGNSWVTFRIASTPRVRDRQSNEWVDGETLWLGCRAYGQYAENIANSLTKGTRVVVQGKLSQRSYTDNQGQQRTSLELEVDEIGPSLRFATAQVTRTASRGEVGGFGGGAPQGQPAWGQPAAPSQPAAESAWAAPSQPAAESAWGAPAQNNPTGNGGSFDDAAF
ncbi:single-stranded DNA-binding protein [Leucobacter sp. OH1287]|nr:single-stranded DNA-binding protein [Leucobacter sp. OH1287]RRD60863.1 single-stranded DNA-binding protein [Leucobacter sp. OH1287]